MILNTGKISYKVIREVFEGKINNVYICQNQNDRKSAYKTVWIVKDRSVARMLIENLEDCCEECFMKNEDACFVFPYMQERPLNRFYLSTIQNKPDIKQRIWLEIVVKCMTSKLSAPLMNLILNQGQINIEPDGSIWFGFLLDLSKYDNTVTEKDNVATCAEIIVELIEKEQTNRKDVVARLLNKKLDKEEYLEFIQLYKDIRLITGEEENEDKTKKITKFVLSEQDKIYKILSVFSIILVCVVIFLDGDLIFF